MEAVETIKEGGYVGEIHYDESPTNPRENGDYHVAVLTQLSHEFLQPDDYFDRRVIEAWSRFRRNTALIERYARVFLDAIAVHWWDDPRSSSRIFGYITREAVETAGITDPLAALNAELNEYAAWCNGEVYGYTVTAPDGEEIDSCWGYYGDDELQYVRDCIFGSIAGHKEMVHAERVATFKELVG